MPVSEFTPNFPDIRHMCTRDRYDCDIDVDPYAFAQYRLRTWPHPAADFTLAHGGGKYAMIYDKVRATGLPNCMAARIPVPTHLNVDVWRRYLDHKTDEADLLQYIQFGFPLGYLGPVSPTEDAQNHPSATRFPNHIDKFIHAEKEAGALIGPFPHPPFTPWVHLSPLMSRPKAESEKRRVITDLTFPNDRSVNAYIMKNSALGEVRQHTLPSVADLASALKRLGTGAYLFTVDIARAYKNFNSDPLDWPLLCVRWNGAYYTDLSMPFGARASSCFMQRIANFVTRVLRDEGMEAMMYLDDVVVVAPDHHVATRQYDRVRAFLAELGLPEAIDKAQPPAKVVRWLGVQVNAADMTLSIPHDKVQAALDIVAKYRGARTISKRQLQSLIGTLVHVAKCVEPARIFISRLLQALRACGDRWYIRVTDDMRADLDWFLEFLGQWNGVSLVPSPDPHKTIYVDACLTGVGASDGKTAYAARVAPDVDPVNNITEIEAANIVIALHTFVTDGDAGGHILVYCDNLPSVQALTSGRAQNPVLAECARAIWMLQAKYAIKVSYSHIAGQENQVADALSRAHTSPAYHQLASEFIKTQNLTVVHPCTFILSNLYPPVLSRCGVELAGGPGRGATGTGPSAWNQGGSADDYIRAARLLPQIPDGPCADERDRCLPMGGIPGQQRNRASNNQEQGVARAGLYETRGGISQWIQSHTCFEGTGCSGKKEGLCVGKEGRDTSSNAEGCSTVNDRRPQWTDGQGGSAINVLWSSKTIRGSPSKRKSIRPPSAPHEERHPSRPPIDSSNQGWQKPTKVRPAKDIYIIPHRRPSHMPNRDSKSRAATKTSPAGQCTSVGIQGRHANPDLLSEGGVGTYNEKDRDQPHPILLA